MTEQGEREALAPCPHCGGTDIALIRPCDLNENGDMDDIEGWLAVCDASNDHTGCGAASGWHIEQAGAIALWNRRVLRREPSSEARDAVAAAQNVIQHDNWLNHEVRAMANYILAADQTKGG